MEVPNKFLVGVAGDKVAVMNPPRGPISREDALLLAAYLVALSFPGDGEFEKVLQAVRST